MNPNLRGEATDRVWRLLRDRDAEYTTYSDAAYLAAGAAEPVIAKLEDTLKVLDALLANVTEVSWAAYRVGSRGSWISRVSAVRWIDGTWVLRDDRQEYLDHGNRWGEWVNAVHLTLPECLGIGHDLALDRARHYFPHIPADELRVSPTGRPPEQEVTP